MSRTAELSRETAETNISVRIDLDGTGESSVATGLPFLDHMLTAVSRHGRFDITLTASGDLHVDDHHTAEDCALVLGAAFDRALGERRGIRRFGTAFVPMDEALARAVIDLSGRPAAVIELGLRREMLGSVAAENLSHFLRSLAVGIRGALHVDLLRGDNDHHRAEAAFKAVGLALRAAVSSDGSQQIPSTKEVL